MTDVIKAGYPTKIKLGGKKLSKNDFQDFLQLQKWSVGSSHNGEPRFRPTNRKMGNENFIFK